QMNENNQIKAGNRVQVISEKNYHTHVVSDIGKLGEVVKAMPVDGPITVALDDGRKIVSERQHLKIVT
ncbi:hypothetical protein, partial [Vibrio sp.]|uniref:hypothetical protein n=1 Tax=Vibrio sp. TaxID=678 RepID=UPI00257CBC3B